MRRFFVLFSLFVVFSCGDIIDEVDENLIDAQGLITQGKCQEALDLLNTMTDIESNSRFYIVKASAQVCFSIYTTTNFFANDVDSVDVSPATDLFPSLALMTTSDDMTTATDIDFTGIRDAINTLLFAGNVSTGTYSDRSSVFNTNDNNDISLFAAYLASVGLGMLARFYGNVNTTTGAKGGGGGGSLCYFQYTDATAQGIVDGSGGDTCANPYTGQAVDATLMCEGIVIVNTLFDILQQSTLPLPTDSGSVSDIDTAISTFITACEALLGAADEVVCTTVSQSTCEGLSTTARQVYYASVFEEMHR